MGLMAVNSSVPRDSSAGPLYLLVSLPEMCILEVFAWPTVSHPLGLSSFNSFNYLLSSVLLSPLKESGAPRV